MEAGETDNNAVNIIAKTQNDSQKHFICGVIEGFYGRPWTTEQRKDLFRKLKKWGMDSYVYAPKDDYKHRAFWRELYTVEEADLLTSLISAAKEHNITFYYALSPGLDMTYSSQKELQTLKRKLDQVSQFGCEAFALLFDDIEPELSKVDKEIYQTFANAQVSVTNEIFSHLGNPKFLFCPTQYCSSRAVPTVQDSEYLNTLGSKLNNDIDIMWTGNKVISKTLTLESIQQLTEILRRPPVIWDNLHANDYDQKRMFLGPYKGRSPELIPHLNGVMTNPNCEFHANTIAIHTLAYWSRCNLDSKLNSSISADIKLETENDDGTTSEDLTSDCGLAKNVYYPRTALKNAINDWLPEFFIEKAAFGPIIKPQVVTTMVLPIIPIVPSLNTCMSLTTTTNTSTTSKSSKTVPEVNTTQLQALADVCSTVNSSNMSPITNAVMNSLVSPTKIITNDDIVNPIPTNVASSIELPKKIPISIVSVPIMAAQANAGRHLHDLIDDNSSSLGSPPNLTNHHSVMLDAKTIDEVDEEEEGEKELLEKSTLSINKATGSNEKTEEMEILPSKLINNLEGAQNQQQHPQVVQNVTEEPKVIHIDNNAVPMDEHNDIIISPLSSQEPMECSSSLNSQTSKKDANKAISSAVNASDDVVMSEISSVQEFNNSMQVESSEASPISTTEMRDDCDTSKLTTASVCTNNSDYKITREDLYLLCDLFYLPFEHGSRAVKLLNDFNWLKANANVLIITHNELTNEKDNKHQQQCMSSSNNSTTTSVVKAKPEVAEWLQRAESFNMSCSGVQELLKKIALCANKEICHDLFPYIWELTCALTLLNGFIKWLTLGDFPPNIFTYTQGSYTWFSRGWKDAFMSGDQEPWVFRGGLIADLQRLMPIDSGNDLFLYKQPELPLCDMFLLRPYTLIDEADVNKVCSSVYMQQNGGMSADNGMVKLSQQLNDFIADSIVGGFLTLSPNFCTIAHHGSSDEIVGYVAAALDAKAFRRNVDICWLPEIREKYDQAMLNTLDGVPANLKEKLKRLINDTHNKTEYFDCPLDVLTAFPAVMTAGVLQDSQKIDDGLIKRLLTVSLAALRANGCFGVHVRVLQDDNELLLTYGKLGFIEAYRDNVSSFIYLGRRF